MSQNIEVVKIEKLIPYARNARTHEDKQVDQIAASIKEFGFNNPILIDDDMGIIAGHGRLLAAKKLQLKEVPTIKLSHLNDNQRKAYIIADNKIAENAGWDTELLALDLKELDNLDFNLELTGFGQKELDKLLEPDVKEGLTDDDDIPDNVESKCKKGDIWQLGNHTLMCGDCTNVQDLDNLMGQTKANLVFTDPPYGVSYADKNEFLNGFGEGHRITKPIQNDHNTVDEMYELWCQVFNLIGEYMTNDSSFYICSPQGGELMMMMMQAINQSPLSLKHTIIWVKNNHVLGRCDYNYKHEPILYGWKKKGTHKFYGNGNCKTSVWNFNKPLKNDLHPTMKPVELVVEAVKNSTQENGILFEPFCGSGSTLIACEKTNRKCFGIEIDPHYCDVIIQRWQDFTGKKAELLNVEEKN